MAQLHPGKADLEAECRATRENLEREAERQRASTMAWIMDHFWLRRKVHFKTLANSVRWMVPRELSTRGMTEAALRAKEARAQGIQPMDDDDERFRVSDDEADDGGEPDSSRDDSGAPVESTFGSERDRERPISPSFAQRVAGVRRACHGIVSGTRADRVVAEEPRQPRPHTR